MTNVHVNRQPLHTIDQNLKHDLGNEMMKPTIITKGRGQLKKEDYKPPHGGHSIVKLNTTCETSLLPLYYMAWKILNFMIFFLHIHNH